MTEDKETKIIDVEEEPTPRSYRYYPTDHENFGNLAKKMKLSQHELFREILRSYIAKLKAREEGIAEEVIDDTQRLETRIKVMEPYYERKTLREHERKIKEIKEMARQSVASRIAIRVFERGLDEGKIEVPLLSLDDFLEPEKILRKLTVKRRGELPALGESDNQDSSQQSEEASSRTEEG